MVKQMLRIAGVKSQKEFYKKYPSEAAFFKAHPEAEMLKHAAMGGSYYADGGGMPPEQAGMQQGQPQEGGGDQQQQVIQAIVQMLQQGMPPEQVVQKLVEMGMPQDQATQMVQAIMQKMQEQGGGQGPQEEMAEGPQGQEAPSQEMAEGQPPMGMYGGGYAYGGPTKQNSTYSAGMSYANGGAYLPEYADQAYGGMYAAGGQASQAGAIIQKVAEMLSQGMQPEAVLTQLIQAKIPKKKAMVLVKQAISMIQQSAGGMSQGQQQMAPDQQQAPMAAYGGPYMPLSSPGNSINYARGGVVNYQKGGEYEMSHSDIQDLINKGYKIQYL